MRVCIANRLLLEKYYDNKMVKLPVCLIIHCSSLRWQTKKKILNFKQTNSIGEKGEKRKKMTIGDYCYCKLISKMKCPLE